MRAGNLDRRIEIQSLAETPDAFGQPIEGWTTFPTVWAQRKDVRGRERFQAQQTLAVRTATFRIRWLPGVEERMRVIDAGTAYDVTGISDDRRQGWMELAGEAVGPEPVTG